ncbi:hypothetical protein [Pseudomonas rhodesiae]|uniref:hypothetical protein n=1 Tax=Pseudomonas rhodesiae TaxID=76760 RepID=UPI00209E1E16|nr:hypothetical protein [Pseudomonas rhodesiae]MCP1512878.1 putative ATPase [Pseudomonas rhodesiae]MDF9771736.1 putative ATPase [Pseudomonas rhodesiae]
MIESICLLNIATYDPEKSEDLVNLNRKIFFCGANCVGKKTISRSIENSAISADSRMSWLRYSQTLDMAYDNDCIFSNFTDWQSVFTLGKIALAQFDRLGLTQGSEKTPRTDEGEVSRASWWGEWQNWKRFRTCFLEQKWSASLGSKINQENNFKSVLVRLKP